MNMTPNRRLRLARAAIGAALLAGAMIAPLCAQPFPNKPLRLIVPFPGAGGGADYVGRVVGQKLSERLGQPVVIENRPGAAGNIGIDMVAKAQPDGYTLLIATPSLTISPSLYKKLSYDPVRDLAPVSLVAEIPNLFIVRPALPVKNLKEFIDYARASPGKLNFGGSGVGSSTHLATVLFLSLAKLDMVNITYKGSSQALIALIGNEVDLVIIGPPAALPHIQAGRVKALAVMRDERLASLPNVPTMKEAGIEKSEVTTWYGLLAPAGTPRAVVTRLNKEWNAAATMPDTLEKMQIAGIETLAGTPEHFAALIKMEIARWSRVVKEARVSVE
jgi:tripartite-type tricarboxylate transporter receptor subunit TctC